MDPQTIEGTDEYTTCNGLLNQSSSTWPNTALFQIANAGITLDKLVIGKPANSGDANNGYIDPSTLAGCVQQAKNQGWGKWLLPCMSIALTDVHCCRRGCHDLGGMYLCIC